jgi:hypothetical protein
VSLLTKILGVLGLLLGAAVTVLLYADGTVPRVIPGASPETVDLVLTALFLVCSSLPVATVWLVYLAVKIAGYTWLSMLLALVHVSTLEVSAERVLEILRARSHDPGLDLLTVVVTGLLAAGTGHLLHHRVKRWVFAGLYLLAGLVLFLYLSGPETLASLGPLLQAMGLRP